MATPVLSRAQRGVLAGALSSRLAELEQRRTSRLHGLSAADDARQTRDDEIGDEAQRAGDREVGARVSTIDDAEFDAVANAIQRIHGIGYGTCADCGDPIPFPRLRAEPQAARCAACQTLHESVA